LATRLRESGLFVMGVGEKKTPDAFVKACERFIYVANLDVQEFPVGVTAEPASQKPGTSRRPCRPAATKPAVAPKPAGQQLSQNAELMRKLRKAFNIAKGEEDEAS
jgi:hypothetical protein